MMKQRICSKTSIMADRRASAHPRSPQLFEVKEAYKQGCHHGKAIEMAGTEAIF